MSEDKNFDNACSAEENGANMPGCEEEREAFEKESEPSFSKGSEFERELENYLPTPENTDKLQKPFPQWAFAAIASAAVCMLILAVYSAAVIPHIKPTAVISYVEGGQRPAEEGSVLVSDISEKTAPCIVTVSATSSYRSFFGISSATNTGSGIVIAPDGYILTSNSLVGDGSSVKVVLPDNREFDARLLGTDGARDIAVLKIEAEGLPSAALGNSDNVRAGDTAVVIGNMLGQELGASVTRGIICGVNNGVALQNGSSVNLLQTDAATTSQSAGGCLLNASGEVVGMITYSFSSQSENISFAIPSNDIRNSTQSLIDTGAAPQGLIIGITGSDHEHGVSVESVMEGTPAEEAGLETGDLILKADGTAVKSIAEINRIRDSHKKGEVIVLSIYRDGETMEIEVTL